jgi:hypothetical protein
MHATGHFPYLSATFVLIVNLRDICLTNETTASSSALI